METSFDRSRSAESKEGKKEKILKVIIGRHGPKLTAEGEKNDIAEYFNEHVKGGFEQMDISKTEEGLVHIGTSEVDRASKTAKIYANELNNTEHRFKEEAVKDGLTVPYQPLKDLESRISKEVKREDYDNDADFASMLESKRGEAKKYADDLDTIMKMQSEIKPRIKKEIDEQFPNLDKITKEAELRNRIDMEVLAALFNDEKINNEKEKKFHTSYNDMADTFAKRYADFAKHAELLQKMKTEGGKQPLEEPYIQIDVSHSFSIMSFLKKFLNFEDGKKSADMEPEEFFERTGGIIRESGSFNMSYERNSDGTLIIAIDGEFSPDRSFKGKLDMEMLKKLNQKKS
ncbi:MAG: hypothetical protein UT37_C0014G0005 [Parcubacteria group bacterium GW2011_GWA2_39_18]|nr:MAG: hypothetical protein UT37_C0014G0005 [Parcubacteria group bacterium GW2011_GWA2_39_18]